ncbi:MAG: hypothetical protein JNJ54_06015 [Myxococcaceae bacterium]|nr:hypothetical protein [Myxococcaceae bacterium]
MTFRHIPLLFVLAGCGGGGSTLKGTVTVEGGSAANVPVAVYGPVSTVALTGDNGAFAANNLPDGAYLVRAIVRGAVVEELSAPVQLSGGKQNVEPVLAFKQKPAPGKLTGRVTVENGSAANVTVFFHGPQSGAATTMADGSFTSSELVDGAYVVHAVVRGAEVEDATASTRLASGRQEGDVTLAFRLPATSQVSGRVVFTDGSDASNLTVVLGGSTFLGARTGAMGAFSFTGVPAGAATVSVEVADTREGRVSLGVAVSGAMVDVGELRLTPVARVGGTVTAGGMPVGGALVRVAGTGAAATTNAAGRFDFVGLGVGDSTFTAELGAQTGTAMARLTRGANADVMVTLTAAPPPPTGTITGVVGFGSPQSPTLITVAAEGTMATARPGPNGAFSLQAPVGTWDITATAPHHPKLLLGRVQVTDGRTTSLPGQVLSFYEPIFDNQATITGLTPLAGVAGQPWVAVQVSDVLRTRNLLVNARTKEIRMLAYGGLSTVVFSPNARYVAYSLANQLFTYEIPTGQTRAWGATNGAFVQFSTDESVMFVLRSWLERITLSSAQVARFPPMTTGTLSVHTNDRILVRDNMTNDVTLVEPTTATALFTNVAGLFTTPTVMALTGCTPPSASCSLRVVAPAGRTSSLVAGFFPSALSVLASSPPDYPLVTFGTTSMMIRASDGTVFPLPANSQNFTFNQLGTRMAFTTTVPSTTREDVVPPPATPNLVVSTSNSQFQYFTPTRLVGFESTTRRMLEVRSGVTTFDADVDGNPPVIAPALAAWRATSTMKWKVIVGDEPAIEVDVPSSTAPGFLANRAGLPVTEFGVIGFEGSSSYLIDGRTNTVRRQLGGPLVTAFRNRNTEFFSGSWSGNEVVMNAETGQLIDFRDPRLANTTSLSAPDNRLQLGSLGGTLWLGVL